MKKFLAFVMAASMALSLAACGGSTPASSTASTTTEATTEAAASGSKTDVAFVTDVGNIDDQSFNQYTWQGVQDFCSANSLNANYYRPTEDSDAARLEQMDNAVNDGAKALVVAGYLFGSSIAEAQAKYPDIQFLALDVSTADLGDTAPTANTALVTYKEEQAGYLAGYAVVMDGYTKLGFLGGMAVPAVIRYGYGWLQGARDAAKELGVEVECNYTYGGQFFGDANITAKMEGWYAGGTEIVFACGGGIYTSAVEAANIHGGKVVGVDVDQSYIDGCIVTSAMKGLQNVTETILGALADGKWDETYGGKFITYSLAEGDYVGIPTAESSWRFNSFTMEQYQAIHDKLKSGEITVDNASDNVNPEIEGITVNYVD